MGQSCCFVLNVKKYSSYPYNSANMHLVTGPRSTVESLLQHLAAVIRAKRWSTTVVNRDFHIFGLWYLYMHAVTTLLCCRLSVFYFISHSQLSSCCSVARLIFCIYGTEKPKISVFTVNNNNQYLQVYYKGNI